MGLRIASIAIGSLMLIGAAPVAAGQRVLASGSGAPVRLAAGDGSTADRDTYTREAQDEMQEWKRKLHDVGEKAEAKGKNAGAAAESELDAAWAKADAASRKLQTAGAEGWDSAKTDFERASHDLAAAWHKNHPDEK